MDLNADNIIKIFEKNKLGKEIKTELGNAIEVNSYDAFIISCLTDTGYVVNKDFPEHFCSQLKIFNSALKYNIIAGIYTIIILTLINVFI